VAESSVVLPPLKPRSAFLPQIEEISIEADGKRLSGRYVVRDGMVTVIASDGRTRTAAIEDSMLSPETLGKTLLLQLHRREAPTEVQ
jgi:hypothetical protein